MFYATFTKSLLMRDKLSNNFIDVLWFKLLR